MFRTEAINDMMTIYDGVDTSGTVLAQLSGVLGGPQYYYATSGSVYITWVSNASVTNNGYLINWSVIP